MNYRCYLEGVVTSRPYQAFVFTEAQAKTWAQAVFDKLTPAQRTAAKVAVYRRHETLETVVEPVSKATA